MRLVEAVSEQIIPADKDPAPRMPGLSLFIDRQLPDRIRNTSQRIARVFALAGDMPPAVRQAFRSSGLGRPNESPDRAGSGSGPKELWKSPTCTEFFNLVLEHTKQGFYGSPQDGGNYNYVSYRMLGLDHDLLPAADSKFGRQAVAF